MPVEIYTKEEVDALLGSPPPEPPPMTGLSSRPVHAEDFGIDADPEADNRAALQAAIDAARASSRWLYLPPGEFRVSGELLCSGVDLRGTQGGLGTRLVLTADDANLLRFTGRAPDGSFDTRGSVRDMLLFATGTGGVAIHARGDATHQPDHLRIERVRIAGLGSGSWHVPVIVNGLDRTTGAIGIRGLYMGEVLIFSATGNYIVLRGVLDANLIGVRCYVPLGSGTPTFFLGGSAAVPNENIYAFGCEAPALYAEHTRDSRIMGSFASVATGAGNTGLIVTA